MNTNALTSLDRAYICDKTQFSPNHDLAVAERIGVISSYGHVIAVEDKCYPKGVSDKYGNTVFERIYTFENGKCHVLRPWRCRTKCMLAPTS